MPQRPLDRDRPTMRDVAREAGVSKALVSIVFRGVPGASESTRARVFATAEELGYRTNRAARLLKLTRTKHVGITLQPRSTFQADLVEAMQAAADRAGYEVVLSAMTATHNERRAIETLLDFRCEALVLLASDLSAGDLGELARTIPVVLVGRHPALTVGVDVVRTSESVGQRLLVQHLGALGHRELVHVDGGTNTIGAERRRGFRAAARQLARESEHVVTARSVRGGPSEADGQRATERLLRGDHLPTAISAFNDDVALGVLSALARAGVRVPQDCSVTGYDNTPVAAFSAVGLTTVSQDAAAQAEWAIKAVVERLDDGRDDVAEEVLQPRLVVRGTTGPPRGR